MVIDYPPGFQIGSNQSLPTIVYVHGGGFVNGTYTYDYKGMFESFLNASFIVASVGYYLPNNQLDQPPPAFPLNIEDVACAVRFLRANAQTYNINPNEIGIFGDSAGANLAALEALSALNGTFDNVGQWLGYSDRVQAVGDLFGMTNLTSPLFLNDSQITTYEDGGGLDLITYVWEDNTTLLYESSPVNYVTSGAPPFMIQQGWDDVVVVPSTSIAFRNELLAHCDQVQLIMVDNMGHAYGQVGSQPMRPSFPTLVSDLVSFFETNLSSNSSSNSSSTSTSSSCTSSSSSASYSSASNTNSSFSLSILTSSSSTSYNLSSTTVASSSSSNKQSLILGTGPLLIAIAVIVATAVSLFFNRKNLIPKS
jgi:acetyl esterase/lipase